jgi:hypothetical protein
MTLASSLIATSAFAATDVKTPADWFAEGEAHGNI